MPKEQHLHPYGYFHVQAWGKPIPVNRMLHKILCGLSYTGTITAIVVDGKKLITVQTI
jgi:hypothetical protein